MKIKYRVIIKVSYNEAWFEFDTAEDACQFTTTALKHMADNEDGKKKSRITIQVVNADSTEEDED